ncbi:MAG: hypothetical protein GTN80_06705 [Nitrososphaeria archaeon]|nr:hypothetical protein [Nitrososphaeria archaeon]NIQ33316.1 hypothetical protein [Nitrososphaeria archaeon]
MRVVLAILCFVGAISLILHQYITWGIPWSWSDVLHHENAALFLIALGIGLLWPRK